MGDTNYLQVVIHDPTGVDELWSNGQLKVFPNPTMGFIQIADQLERHLPYTLTDIYGQQVLTGMQTNGQKIDLSVFPSGVYFLQLGNSASLLKLVLIQ